jgi:H+/Cl- antiporter ClcA
MARRAVWYGMAAVFPAAFVAASVGPFRCGIYGCTGGANPTLHTFLVGAGLGAVAGLVAMALIDIVINGRYVLANRAEAKARRLRDARRNQTKPNPRDVGPDAPLSGG